MYDASHELQYLDMVLEETLRMYPPAPGWVGDSLCVSLILRYQVPYEQNYIASNNSSILLIGLLRTVKLSICLMPVIRTCTVFMVCIFCKYPWCEDFHNFIFVKPLPADFTNDIYCTQTWALAKLRHSCTIVQLCYRLMSHSCHLHVAKHTF